MCEESRLFESVDIITLGPIIPHKFHLSLSFNSQLAIATSAKKCWHKRLDSMNVEKYFIFAAYDGTFMCAKRKFSRKNFNLRSEKNFFIKFYQTLQQHTAIVFLPVLSRWMASMTPTHKLYSLSLFLFHMLKKMFFLFPIIKFCVCARQHTCLSEGTRFEWKIRFERLLVSLRNDDDDDDDKTMWIWYKCEMCVGRYYWTLTSIEEKSPRKI